jgi:hypothetical protein
MAILKVTTRSINCLSFCLGWRKRETFKCFRPTQKPKTKQIKEEKRNTQIFTKTTGALTKTKVDSQLFVIHLLSTRQKCEEAASREYEVVQSYTQMNYWYPSHIFPKFTKWRIKYNGFQNVKIRITSIFPS